MGSSNDVLVLTVDPSVLANAPSFDTTAFNGKVDSAVANFWAGQSGITVTGASGSSAYMVNSPVLLTSSSMTGQKITDAAGANLAEVKDFVVDTTTGQLVYAVLANGATFNGKSYVVPLANINWQASTSSSGSAGGIGSFMLNASSSAFSSAPSVDMTNGLDLSNSTWNSGVNSYWSTVK